MNPALIAALLWLLFAGTHIGLATRRVRGCLVARLGPWGFGYLYSAIAALTFSLFVHYYATARFDGAAGLEWSRFAAFRYAAIAAIGLGLALMTGSLWQFPASALASVDPRPPSPRGLERITRHPFFVGTAVLSASHALLAAHLVGTVTFGGLALLAIAGSIHQDRKLRAQFGDLWQQYLAETSIAPFAAVALGRQRIVWHEIPWIGLAVGIAIAYLLRSVHGSILASGGIWVIAVVIGGAAAALIQTLVRRRRRVDALLEPSADPLRR